MLIQRVITTFAVAVLGLTLVAGAAAQVPAGGKGSASQMRQPLKLIIVKGKIKHLSSMGGYYLAGTPEVYLIANQNPKVLGDLEKSGNTVTIEAKPNGDLLTIEKIDGKPYQGTQKPVFK